MKKYTEEFLTEIGKQEKQFDALYRDVSSSFGLPDCSMWVLYYLASTADDISQQDLIEKMMFPKQTINSAVTALAGKGFVELSMIPGTRNRKKITLTDEGKKLSESTVLKMRQAECRAVERMGKDKMAQFTSLYHDFFNRLQIEFEKEGLIDA